MQLSNLDPAHLVQLQFQMLATGTSKGYLISWSRTDLSVHLVKYHHEFAVAAAQVLKFVVEQFIDPDQMPELPKSVSDMKEDLRSAYRAMLPHYRDMVLSCERVDQDERVPLCSL